MSSTTSDTFSLFNQKKTINPSAEMEVADIQEFYYMTHIDNLPSILEKGILSHTRVETLKKEKKLEPKDISDRKVQDKREREKIVSYLGRRTKPYEVPLHRFANLYLNPHNAMMAVVAPKTPDLCILRITREVLERGDVILTSQNAATKDVAFTSYDSWRLSPESSNYLSRASSKTKDESQAGNVDREFERLAELCKTNRQEFDKEFPGGAKKFFSEEKQKVKGAVQKARKAKQVRQAEALIRSKVKPRFITGIFVPDKVRQEKVNKILTESKRTDVAVTQHLSLFIGYKAEGQIKGSYRDLAPFMVPRLDEFKKKELLRWDNGYPSDLSDEEDSLSSSSTSFSSPFSTPSKRQKKDDEMDEEKLPSPLKLEDEGDYPLGRLPILTAKKDRIIRKITELEEELANQKEQLRLIEIEIEKETPSSSSSMSSSSFSSSSS